MRGGGPSLRSTCLSETDVVSLELPYGHAESASHSETPNEVRKRTCLYALILMDAVFAMFTLSKVNYIQYILKVGF